jgi:carboxyl-terminal processing protease
MVIGEPTFGKGSVQQLVDLRQGQLKLTTAMFYRVSGQSTQYQGVTPDIQLPAVYDPTLLGESALEGALPPDNVSSARFQARPRPSAETLDWIRARHAARIRSDPEFAYLQAGIDHERQARDRKFISLREETRRRERTAEDRWRLEQENKRRAAKGLAAVKRLADLEGEEKEPEGRGPGGARRAEPDPLQMESGRILADLLQRGGALTGMAGGPAPGAATRGGS